MVLAGVRKGSRGWDKGTNFMGRTWRDRLSISLAIDEWGFVIRESSPYLKRGGIAAVRMHVVYTK